MEDSDLSRGAIAARSIGREVCSGARHRELASFPVWPRLKEAGQTRADGDRAGHVSQERIIWRGRGSGMFLLISVWPLLAVLLVLQAFGLPLLVTTLFVLVTFVAWWIPTRGCRWVFHRYTVTEASAFLSSGIVRSRREEVELRSVVRIHVEQRSLMQKVLDTGNVELRTVTRDLTLVAVSRPREIANAILAHLAPRETQLTIWGARHASAPRGAAVEGSADFPTLPSTLPNRSPSDGGGSYIRAGMRYDGHFPEAIVRDGTHIYSVSEDNSAAQPEIHRYERPPSVAPSPFVMDVPEVIGLPLLDAIVKVQSAGLDLLVVGERPMATCALGQVLEQIPHSGICRLVVAEVRVVLARKLGT
jgi:membrane protein YdbS with pleckstrin-like domain